MNSKQYSLANRSSGFDVSLAHFLIHLEVLLELGVLLDVEGLQNGLALLALRKSVLLVISLLIVPFFDWLLLLFFTAAFSFSVDRLEVSPHVGGDLGNLVPVWALNFMLFEFLLEDEVERVVAAS